jgi:hypothetical protein
MRNWTYFLIGLKVAPAYWKKIERGKQFVSCMNTLAYYDRAQNVISLTSVDNYILFSYG